MTSEAASPAAELPSHVSAAAAYGLGSYTAILLNGAQGDGDGIWIANAMAVAILLATSGRRRRIARGGLMAAAGFGAMLLAGLPLWLSLSTMLLNTLEFAAPVLVLTAILPLERVRARAGGVAAFALLIAVAAALAPALTGLGWLVVEKKADMACWAAWWTSSSLGAVLVLSLTETAARGGAREALAWRNAAKIVALAIFTIVWAYFSVSYSHYPFVVAQLPLLAAIIVIPPFGTAILGVVDTLFVINDLQPAILGGFANGAAPMADVFVSAEFVMLAPVALAIAVHEISLGRTIAAAQSERFRRLIESAPIGNALVSPEGIIESASRVLEARIGAPLAGRRFDDLVHPDDRDLERRAIEAVASGRQRDHRVEKRLLRADGTVFWAVLAATAERNDAGAIDRLMIQVDDIDDRKRAERQLAEAEERWKFALENSGQAVWDVDYPTGRAFHSPRWKAMLGYGEDELPDHPDLWLEHMHPDDRAAAKAADAAHLRGETNQMEGEFRLRHKDGRWLWVRDKGKIVARDEFGKPLRAIGTHYDITEEREAAARLASLAARVQLSTDAAGVGLFEISRSGPAIWWNDQMHRLHGTDSLHFTPTVARWWRLVHPDDVRRVMASMRQALRDGALLDTEYRILHADGSLRVIRAVARRRDDGPLALVGINLDVTAEREATDRLTLANEHIGQFAAIASHDLQAPLRQIALWADVLRVDASSRLDDASLEIIERIQRRARQMRRMIVGLLEFSRAGGEVRMETMDLSRIAKESVADYAQDLGDVGGEVVVDLLPRALGDPLMMAQIFGNLISNAIKYRGKEPLRVVISGQVAPGLVIVTVRDNGVGIDKTYAKSIFEIFRRLPHATALEGSGIGLAVCQRMVDAMGGSISLDPDVDKGSMFVVRLRPVPMGHRMVGARRDD